MRCELNNFNLPTIEDFRKNGKFYKVKLKKSEFNLNCEVYRCCFPDYAEYMFRTKDPPNKKTNKLIFNYCVSLKKQAMKEERLFQKKLIHDYDMKQWEEKIKEFWVNYYENKYKNCKCFIRNNKS